VVGGGLLIATINSSSTGSTVTTHPPHPPPHVGSCTPPPPAGGPTIVSCVAAVGSSRPVETTTFTAPSGSLILAFLSFVGASGGGGGPDLITDSMGDWYDYIAGAGMNQSLTEELYAADVPAGDANMTVSVTVEGGPAPQGASVSVVDIANATLGSVGAFVSSTGTGATATLTLTDTAPGDLNLLSVAGPGPTGPYAASEGETLLDTGNGTTGPLEASIGFGTFAVERNATSSSDLTANLHAPGTWDAIGVSLALGSPFVPPPAASTCAGPFPSGQPSVYYCTGAVSDANPVTTVGIPTEQDSLVLVFVSYVSQVAGGPISASVSDSNLDPFTLLNSTGLSLNHTESLYATQVGIPAFISVSVSFADSGAPAGGSVAVVDVANASLASVDTTAWATGLHGSANVTVSAHHAGDLFLLGAAGRAASGPYSPGPDENLLDTGAALSGPYGDGTGYGTFALFSSQTAVSLSANLNYPTFWDAIGVAVGESAPSQTSSRCVPPVPTTGPSIYSCVGTVGNETTTTTLPFNTTAGSLLLVFVSYCNVQIGGGFPSAISDSLGDSFALVTTTGGALNHTETLYATNISSASLNVTVSVTFIGGATPQGGSVAVIDVSKANLTSIDQSGWNTGVIGSANVTLTTSHPGDLFLLGAAGRGVSGPYGPGPNMALLDTGTATAGPFFDGIGYGTFETVSTDTTVNLSATLNYPTYWEAVGVAIDA